MDDTVMTDNPEVAGPVSLAGYPTELLVESVVYPGLFYVSQHNKLVMIDKDALDGIGMEVTKIELETCVLEFTRRDKTGELVLEFTPRVEGAESTEYYGAELTAIAEAISAGVALELDELAKAIWNPTRSVMCFEEPLIVCAEGDKKFASIPGFSRYAISEDGELHDMVEDEAIPHDPKCNILEATDLLKSDTDVERLVVRDMLVARAWNREYTMWGSKLRTSDGTAGEINPNEEWDGFAMTFAGSLRLPEGWAVELQHIENVGEVAYVVNDETDIRFTVWQLYIALVQGTNVRLKDLGAMTFNRHGGISFYGWAPDTTEILDGEEFKLIPGAEPWMVSPTARLALKGTGLIAPPVVRMDAVEQDPYRHPHAPAWAVMCHFGSNVTPLHEVLQTK